MILIPLPKKQSRGDQILNANNFQSEGYANVINQEDLSLDTLLTKITETLNNKNYYINNMNKSKFTCGNKKLIELIEKTIL